MKEMISQKLLEIVLGSDYKERIVMEINIYELAHKCKEWLEKECHNYDIMIVESDVFLMNNIWGEGGAYVDKTFDKEKEWYLNIFKACQWILDNKDSKG